MNFSQHEWGVFPIPKTFVIIKITLKSQKTKIFTKSQTKIERDSQKGGEVRNLGRKKQIIP